jgi:nitrate reductase assembly molybdenum cofactor insertion protein NarJ
MNSHGGTLSNLHSKREEPPAFLPVVLSFGGGVTLERVSG